MSSTPADNDRKVLLKNALMAIEEMQAKLDAAERAKNAPIAIIGMSCRFPGGANSPEAFWQLLQNGGDAIREVPPERWNVADYAGANAMWYGGFLDDIDRFDPQFFGISPREAANIDPQQRLVLEVAWEALENAGIAPDRLTNSLTGVFMGITTNDYAQLVKQSSGLEMDVYSATGTALNAAPGRLAYTLGLQGPSVAVDTACSSSLVALHLACQSLRNGESNLALAGGVNATLVPENFVCFAGWGMMAPDGRCKTFDARADGFVRGEGCGVIVLKRLSDALADGDPVLAVVRGSAVNQDGRSSGLTVPNGLAQQAVIRQALVNAGVKPADVSYIEAHGTGTSLGDPIEVEAIGAALGDGRGDRALMIGSVKTNIGHLESASGIAGLIKVVLSMQHGELPPHLHLQERSPRIPWPNFPIVIPGEPTPWTAQPRIAGVSSFGFSGTNAHVVLEEAPAREPAAGGSERPAHILTLSARGEPALRQLAQRYADYLASSPSLADAAYTANIGRARLSHRLAVVAETPEQAREALALFAAGQEAPGLVSGMAAGGRPKVAFLFTGQGAQYAGMGRELYDTQPTFRAALDECDRLLRSHLERPLLSVIYPEAGEESPLDHTTYTQPALFALEYALAKLWQSWGIEPSAVMGHSVGEYVAACLAGVFSLEDGLKLIAARGRLMGDLPEGGQMAAVFADESTVKAAVAPYARDVSIAAVNGPENIVISGAGESVQAVVASLSEHGIRSRALVVSHAFHSPLMEPMLEAFERVAGQVRYNRPRLKLVSNVTGQFADADVTDARYWRAHVREAVRFGDAVQMLYETGYRVFVEIGPGTTLLGMGQRCLPNGADAVWLPSLRKGQGDWQSILTSLGALFVHGLDISWDGFEGDYARRSKVALPTYPFQRERYWITDVAGAGSAFVSPARDPHAHPLLGSRLNLAHTGGAFVWENEISLKRQAYLTDHRVEGAVVVPATAYVEMAMSAVTELIGSHPLAVNSVQNRKPLFLDENGMYTVQTVLTPATGGAFTFEVYSRRANIAGAAWTLHVTGRLEPDVEQTLTAVFDALDLDAVMARCTEELTGADFYRQLSEKGNQWGPNFQGVERLWRGNGEALSLVRVPAALAGDMGRYLFHPAVSDSCGHVLTATISTEKTDRSKGGAFVGGGIDESRIYRHPDTLELWCYARLRPDEGDENVLIGDVAAFDENGTLISETIGARLWYLDHESPAPAASDNLDNWFYEIQWTPAEMTPAADTASGDWLILADSTGVGGEVAALLQSRGARPVIAFAGANCEQIGEGAYTIRPGEREDFRAVLGTGAFRGIVHLWSLDTPSAPDMTSAGLDAARARSLDSTARLVQALTDQNGADPPRLWLVTRGAMPAGETPHVQAAQAPLWGVGRTITLEHSELWGGLVDLDPAASAQVSAGQLWNAVTGAKAEDQQVFRDGQVYVPRLVRRQVVAKDDLSFQCRVDGSYLITGGMGGLGLEVARWLVEKGARRLILMGRTPLPPRKQWGQVEPGSEHGRRIAAVRGLEAMGASVHLAFVDVGDEAALRDFLETYEAEGWPPVRGVVHAAGVMQYQPLVEQTPADAARIFRPKAAGAWLLHTLLKDAPLDFFVLFSSTSALLSSPMMGGYAAANTFLDALAHERRALGLPALSINWGTWGEAGMATRFEGGDRAVAVMQTISNRQGLEALERLLRQPSAQVGVMPVDWSHWQKLYPAFSRAPLLEQVMRDETVETARQPEGGPTVRSAILAAAPEERASRLQDFLAQQVSRILGFAAGNLDVTQSVSHLGMDSLMAVELKNRVETSLGVVIPMVQLLQGPSVVELTAWVAEKLDTAGGLEEDESIASSSRGEMLVQGDQNWEEGEL